MALPAEGRIETSGGEVVDLYDPVARLRGPPPGMSLIVRHCPNAGVTGTWHAGTAAPGRGSRILAVRGAAVDSASIQWKARPAPSRPALSPLPTTPVTPDDPTEEPTGLAVAPR